MLCYNSSLPRSVILEVTMFLPPPVSTSARFTGRGQQNDEKRSSLSNSGSGACVGWKTNMSAAGGCVW